MTQEDCPGCDWEGFGPWSMCPRCGYKPEEDSDE